MLIVIVTTADDSFHYRHFNKICWSLSVGTTINGMLRHVEFVAVYKCSLSNVFGFMVILFCRLILFLTILYDGNSSTFVNINVADLHTKSRKV